MKKVLFGLIVAASLFSSCKREFDSPPVREIPEGEILTVTELRNMNNGLSHKFVGDSSVYAVVIGDETSGNLYKEVYISDGDAALNVRLISSGGLYTGDSIRIYLKGTVLSEFNGVLQLDSVDVNTNVIKQATGKTITPKVVDVTQITPALQGHLVQLNNVEFAPNAQGLTYADQVNQQARNLDLTDCNGNIVLVRTSGYANFAGDVVPSGNGSILAIVGQFGTDMQLYIRKPAELGFNNTACGGVPPGTYVNKTWEDQDLTSGGWSSQLVTGTLNWSTSDIGSGTWYAKMSNYNGSANENSESWLISPSMDFSAAINPEMNFETAFNYTGPSLEIMISTDYDGSSNPSTQGTWSPLSATLSSGSWSWTPSGSIDLSSYNGNSSVYVAFKYTGNAPSSGSTWQLDNVNISEN